MEANDDSAISDKDFARFQQLLYELAGIHLASSKKVLLVGRLGRRLRALKLDSFGQYFERVTSLGQEEELQIMVDLLTTHETYFFREPRHFEILAKEILPRHRGGSFDAWSAACSSGEEAYSLAMVLAEVLGDRPWRVTASDISTEVLEHARRARYPLERASGIPHDHLRKYCLKGVGENAGTMLISRELRNRVDFRRINLNECLPAIGPFDVIFLRNVMIYFDLDTKRRVVGRLLSRLKPDGWLIIGHSETLNGVTDQLTAVRPTLYRRAPERR